MCPQITCLRGCKVTLVTFVSFFPTDDDVYCDEEKNKKLRTIPKKSWDENIRLIPYRKIPVYRDFAKIPYRTGMKFLIPLGPGGGGRMTVPNNLLTPTRRCDGQKPTAGSVIHNWVLLGIADKWSSSQKQTFINHLFSPDLTSYFISSSFHPSSIRCDTFELFLANWIQRRGWERGHQKSWTTGV